MELIRAVIRSRRALFAVLVISVIAVGGVSGVAVAQEATDQSTATDVSTTSSTTTSTSDPTTSTTDPTTSTTDPTTTTSDDLDATTSSSDETNTEQTTTTSDALNELSVVSASSVEPRSHTTYPCDDNGKTEGQFTNGAVFTVTVGGGTDIVHITITSSADGTSATWQSDAPFVGQIYVKSSNIPNPGALQADIHDPGQTTGTLTTPATNQNGQPQQISHVHFCGARGTTVTTTVPNTTTTQTTTATGGTAGTTQGGGGGGGGNQGVQAGTTSAAATQATTASGGLPFTGLHAPLLVLIAAGMVAAGLALRKRVNGSA